MSVNQNNLFNSKTEPIPALRRDIDIIPVENNGDSALYFHDSRGYVTPNFALHSKVATILSLLDGHKTIEDLSPWLGEEVSTDQLLAYIQFLDENRVLHSRHFKKHAEEIERNYEASDTHESVTAGFSYPSDPGELVAYLDEAFSNIERPELDHHKQIKALYAPHIDPRVGMESYVKAFNSIRDITPKRVVILATSHYAELYAEYYNNEPFIISDKKFELPLGTILPDREGIHQLLESQPNAGLTGRDRAHRIEHSIELPLLFLSYLWNHDYQIIPVLVSGLDDLFYMENGYRARQVTAFGEKLQELFGDDGATIFLISGDLAHIGKKFGDKKPAQELLGEVQSFDRSFLQYARQGDQQKLLNLMKDQCDPYRICGFPPLYTFLKSIPGLKGEILNYDLWDERERESAVTFGSILYSK